MRPIFVAAVLGVLLGLLGMAVSFASAQQPATAVQLPTFSMFTTSTTVSVPDRGNVLLGGINRAATGRNEFGTPLLPFRPFRNSGIGTDRSASSMRVSAYIHDFEAMEEALMSQPTTRRVSSNRRLPRSQAAAYAQTIQPRAGTATSLETTWQPDLPEAEEPPAVSVADARAHRARQKHTRAGEAMDFFARGQRAEAEGKANVARIYYQMAARRAEGELKGRVTATLDAISRAQTGSQLAGGQP